MRSEYSFTVSSDIAIDFKRIHKDMESCNEAYCVVEGIKKGMYVCCVNNSIFKKAQNIYNITLLAILEHRGAWNGKGMPVLITHEDLRVITNAVKAIKRASYRCPDRKTITVKGVKI